MGKFLASLKEWGVAASGFAMAIYAILDMMQCAKEKSVMQAAIQALADTAFTQP